ncbi:cbb3-type cytochrome oxidase assembly protein CcoS [Thalassotalea euphylliae]|uniref:Cbb3-type cytochrome oxidase assembly protein CcoS n=1 Tax=Thalassotalea euphylliae TaxID=1655234 RepID=A0A3E0U0E7_9GAMM|nr:cbb3-type cytochrome oxidase assembly protein CcoS [Thalassotalea euphylliae]REL29685.1 cbb3-type cytochrome oxidase assembly protein CcoS [Thalassotalea euphylliae]
MSVIYVLIPIAIILLIVGIYLFFWAVKTEQFNDLEKEGLSILFDDEKLKDETANTGVINTEASEQSSGTSSDTSNKR